MTYTLLFICFGAVALGIIYIVHQFVRMKKQPVKDAKVIELQGYIKEGAMTFLRREYSIIVLFVIGLGILIATFLGAEPDAGLFAGSAIATAVSFIIGAVFAMCGGFIGMRAGVLANGPTAQAAKDKGMAAALKIAFSGGSISGLTLASIGLFGLTGLILFFTHVIYGTDQISLVISVVTGFSLGASFVALFARVGGGIYTKIADVGADLVGKVEAGIPEDDPRNPAVLADNVGDNVGDIAGLGADLYESYVSSIIAAVSLGALIPVAAMGLGGSEEYSVIARVLFPMLVSAGGILASVIAAISVQLGGGKDPAKALQRGLQVAALLTSVITLILSFVLFEAYQIQAFLAVFFGIAVGVGVGLITEYYTSDKYKHIQYVKKMSETGAATNIIGGFATGLFSAWPVALLMAIGIIAAALVGGDNNSMYFMALCSVGMLATLGMTVAIDSYGPISDNAGGLVEMSKMGDEVRAITDHLDAVGNTTAAIGKGFSVGSAAFTVVGLFATFVIRLRLLDGGAEILSHFTIYNPIVMAMALIGAGVPYLFSAFSIKSVGKAANEMVEEVRRQFRETPGLMEGEEGVKPDYKRCIDISTKAALRELVMPGLLAVIAPIAAGILFGFVGLAGLLLGTFVSGILLAFFMGNVGGVWDNAKKSFDPVKYKGTEIFNAAVIGDTVGDPLKDTAGPAIDILVKLMTILSVVFIPLFASIGDGMGLLGRFFF
ncbi:MAG: sodium-translocating pyrophosphatase [Lachnospiraceae bacterium]|nr:sodium-translocating pyrophosphatase [Lachnospiraceae bacterium]